MLAKYWGYLKQLAFPDRQGSVFRKCVAFLEGTDLKWRARGSARGLELGHYFEFGVWNGDSLVEFRKAVKGYLGHVPRDRWKLYGFDTFEGLPAPRGDADAHRFVGEGSFSSLGMETVVTRLKKVGLRDGEFRLVPGLFEKSLTRELKKELGYPKASFVNIDVDYYSSTVCALNWVEELLADGSIVYFDDIMFYNGHPRKGELKAISDFNASRSDRGLYEARGLDPWGRVYVYWTDRNSSREDLQFKEWVTKHG